MLVYLLQIMSRENQLAIISTIYCAIPTETTITLTIDGFGFWREVRCHNNKSTFNVIHIPKRCGIYKEHSQTPFQIYQVYQKLSY